MLQIPGPPALSEFRLAKLLERLQGLDRAVSALEARFVHFIDLAAPLGAKARAVLEALLNYGPQPTAALRGGAAASVLIVPRIGTISPWSSKATDIARVCGLTSVRRIERGISYALHGQAAPATDSLQRLAALLHDRMTEQPLFDATQAATRACRARRRPRGARRR
jgi:phosphoribosylformylglycinamidine synthase